MIKKRELPGLAGEDFVIAVLAAIIGEIDVSRHIRGLLRRRPVSEIINNTAIFKKHRLQ